MIKLVNNRQATFGRALWLSSPTHRRELLSALVGIGFLLLVPCASAQKLPTSSSSSQNKQGTPQSVLAAAASKPAQQEQAPQQSPPPSTPEQAQPKPLQVTYEAGQLTILAENSRLSDILSSLRACMGADIDLPAGASGELIWARV